MNHTFEFFLSDGWQPYVLSCLVYLAIAFLVVTGLPRKAGLIAVLSLIFGHYFGGSNWLAVRWHLGFTGVALYSLALSVAIIIAASSMQAGAADQIIRRLRWVMLGVMLFDPLVTLLGQPGSYWHHPETVLEGNPIWNWFMMRGWLAYVVADLVYCLAAFRLVSFLPRLYASIGIFVFTFVHFIGASNWFFYVWRLGMEAPAIYGIVLSSIIVLLSCRRIPKPNEVPDVAVRPTSVLLSFCCQYRL